MGKRNELMGRLGLLNALATVGLGIVGGFGSHRLGRRSRSAYMPHQGTRECARRMRQEKLREERLAAIRGICNGA